MGAEQGAEGKVQPQRAGLWLGAVPLMGRWVTGLQPGRATQGAEARPWGQLEHVGPQVMARDGLGWPLFCVRSASPVLLVALYLFLARGRGSVADRNEPAAA